jgi:peptidoglycan/xylan/chitin deacetylase (PgdA/CDA1 family)
MNKRLLVAQLLEKSGATAMMLGLRRTARLDWLPVVTFHRVLDPTQAAQPYLYDDGVVDTSPADFERQVATIRRYFTPVAITDVLAALDGLPLPANPILVTFDDGYRDNFDTALPILKKHDVHAVFFIATHYITHRRMFWWDRINYILKKCPRASITLSYPCDLVLRLDTPAHRAASIRTALRIVKDHRGLDLARFLEELTAPSSVYWSDALERELGDAAAMTWDHVRALRAAGMDVESHTRTHRVLQTLTTAAELHDEVHGSRVELEGQIGAPVTAISYPVGHRLGDRDDLRDLLRTSGYRLGFTNGTGTHRLCKDGDPYDVSRLCVDYGMSAALFAAMLAAPRVFG